MRPIHLSISAFGSFHGKTEIPFDELGEKGMFLIWGKTGSGKTTIFDALCYALYGKTSGETRTDKMIRSDRAEISQMTEVELTFQYGGKIYRILRSPDQMRPKARGQGETISRKSVTLTCPEGRQLRGDEAERHILELLGLDYNQFRQIALIAQGEFRRLLFADSNKRKEIYRRVFYTENYFRLQEALKNDLSQLENQARGKRERMAQFLEGLKVKEDSPLLSEAQLAKDSRLLTPETLELLQGLLKEDEARESLNLSRGRKLKEEADTLRDRLSKAEEQKKAKAAREEALRVIEEAREPLRQAGEQWEQEKARREETKKVENRLVELRRELADFAALQEEQKNSEGLLQQIRQQEEELGALQRELNRCLREEAQTQEALSALEGAEDLWRQALDRFQEMKDRLEKEAEMERRREELSRLEQSWQQAGEEYREKQKAAELRRQESFALQRRYLDEQAGLLALSLQEGTPCPVCGSLHHPAPASVSDRAPTPRDLEEAEARAKAAEEAYRKAGEEAGRRKGIYLESEKGLLEEAGKLCGKALSPESLSEALAAMKAESEAALQRRQEEADSAKVQWERKNDLQKNQLPSLAEEKRQLESERGKLEKEGVRCREALKGADGNIRRLQALLSHETIEEAKGEEADLIRRKSEADQALQEAEKQYRLWKEKTDRAQSRFEMAEKLLENTPVYEEEGERQRLEELEEAGRQNQAELMAVKNRLETNRSIFVNVQETARALSEMEKHIQWLEPLSKTAAGELNGKAKITLETFVQMVYLDRILYRASRRLMKMTGNQFELVRRIEKGLKSRSGLDLDVLDHVSGTQREIGSLSGGEQFMAALSLALGTSDEVQSASGGIRLETMFIDEGFGSLDEDTLPQAMEALRDLSEGNKLIGIISHVSALKNWTDRVIEVSKDPFEGSRISLSQRKTGE